MDVEIKTKEEKISEISSKLEYIAQTFDRDVNRMVTGFISGVIEKEKMKDRLKFTIRTTYQGSLSSFMELIDDYGPGLVSETIFRYKNQPLT